MDNEQKIWVQCCICGVKIQDGDMHFTDIIRNKSWCFVHGSKHEED